MKPKERHAATDDAQAKAHTNRKTAAQHLRIALLNQLAALVIKAKAEYWRNEEEHRLMKKHFGSQLSYLQSLPTDPTAPSKEENDEPGAKKSKSEAPSDSYGRRSRKRSAKHRNHRKVLNKLPGRGHEATIRNSQLRRRCHGPQVGRDTTGRPCGGNHRPGCRTAARFQTKQDRSDGRRPCGNSKLGRGNVRCRKNSHGKHRKGQRATHEIQDPTAPARGSYRPNERKSQGWPPSCNRIEIKAAKSCRGCRRNVAGSISPFFHISQEQCLGSKNQANASTCEPGSYTAARTIPARTVPAASKCPTVRNALITMITVLTFANFKEVSA